MSLTRRCLHWKSPSPEPKLPPLADCLAVLRRGVLAVACLGMAAPGLATPGQQRLARLPVGAQAAVSGTLGRADGAYHAVPSTGGLRAENGRNDLRIDFGRDGVSVACGADRIRLELRAAGYGETLTPVAPATPVGMGNRVEYRRRNLIEWYVNGPLGLEQGFTLTAPPGRRKAGPLTLALSISGSLTASPEVGRTGLRLEQGGQASLFYRNLTAIDHAGRELSAWLELAKKDALLVRIDDAAAQYPVVIDPFIQKATLVASDPVGNDFFGAAVALSGETIVVGAYRPPQPVAPPGSAYVFVKPSSGWSGTLTESAELKASDEASGDWFGISVGVSGNTVVIGAQYATVGSNGDQGAAYVFVKPLNGWAGTLTENAKLTASDGSVSEQFGSSLAVDGDTVVVGLSSDNIGGQDNQGSAYVFSKPLTGWAGALTENAKLTASDGSANDEFGLSVGVSGDTVVVGAYGDGPGNSATAVGAVYVFVKPGNSWAGSLTQNAKLAASDGVDLDALGISVAVKDDTIFAGAPGLFYGREGAAYVFVRPVNGWTDATQNAKLTASDATFDDHLGSLVEVAGNTVLVGSRKSNISTAAYLFVKPLNGWADATQTEKVTSSTVAFCCTVAFAGKTIVVGEDALERALVFERPYIIVLDLAKLLKKKLFNSGSTIPVKFQISDSDGATVSEAEARRLVESCSVQIFFNGGDPSPNCAVWNGNHFQFNLKTSRGLAPGSYTLTVKAFVGADEAGSQSVEVMIR